MAQVKIFARRETIDVHQKALSDSIHRVLQEALGLPAEKRFHRFIAFDDADFIYPDDRGAQYTIIEIVMFTGRSDAAKRACLEGLMAQVPQAIGMPTRDLEIVILESPKNNWGIRGKVADQLELTYRVEV